VLHADMGVLGLLPLVPRFVVGGLSGKSGVLIMKKIMYLCFATFLRTTYNTSNLCLHTLSAWVAGQGIVG
jgi:hypothetical protein